MCATIWHDHPNSRPSIAQHVGGYDANPIEQLHARTVERIIKDYPEFPYKARDKAPAKMSTSKKQTMTWDADTNKRLLLAFLAHYGDLKIDFDVLANMMGDHCSPRAVQEQIKKLRKDAKAGFDPTSPAMTAAAASKASSTKETPTKATRGKKVAAAPKTTKSKRGAKGKAVEENTDDDEELKEEQEPARKKRRYMNSAAAQGEPIGRELANEMTAAYNNTA